MMACIFNSLWISSIVFSFRSSSLLTIILIFLFCTLCIFLICALEAMHMGTAGYSRTGLIKALYKCSFVFRFKLLNLFSLFVWNFAVLILFVMCVTIPVIYSLPQGIYFSRTSGAKPRSTGGRKSTQETESLRRMGFFVR